MIIKTRGTQNYLNVPVSHRKGPNFNDRGAVKVFVPRKRIWGIYGRYRAISKKHRVQKRIRGARQIHNSTILTNLDKHKLFKCHFKARKALNF